ncbi:MAG: methylmalonyl-CoA mutase small subunit [Microbacter sp.]
MNQTHSLFSEFPPVSTQEWMDKINADLKGADFNKKLVWHTNEGFDVQPFYRKEDLTGLQTIAENPGKFPYVRGTKQTNQWRIRQKVHVCKQCADTALDKIVAMIENGITAIDISFDNNAVNAEILKKLLKHVDLTKIELHLDTCVMSAVTLVNLLVDYVKDQHIDPKKVYGSINFDPIGHRLIEGKKVDKLIDRYAALLSASEYLPKFRTVTVNPVLLNNAGAYIYQELGYALAWGNDLLANLVEKGFNAEKTGKKMIFNFGVSSNYFMEIAKFRAARFLWSNIVFAYGEKCPNQCKNNEPDGLERCASKMVIHAQTSQWNMTVYDSYVNMLRTQTEAMSAVIGGVNSLTVLPFDISYKQPDNFSERIARNQQLLLKEESHFDKVTDPGAGSYYIENLTQSIANQAWKLFLEVEEKGGFIAQLESGIVQQAVNETNKNRRKAIATRREILLGTNQYPNFNETMIEKIEESFTNGCQPQPEIVTLDLKRGSAEFETLRLATEKSGKRPKVFLLTIGNMAMRLARAQFSSNFFGCAGYQIIDNLGFSNIAEGIDAAKKHQADIVVLCSSDEEYDQYAPQAQSLLGSSAILVIAGAPACMETLKTQGITEFIHIRSNVLETLQHFHRLLNIG